MSKIKVVNDLVKVLVKNAVRESQGLRGDRNDERVKMRKLLRIVLDKEPDTQDIESALSELE